MLDKYHNLDLKSHVLSQIGRLFNALKLYDKAVPYIQKAIEADSILNNNINLIHDNQILGAIYFHDKQYTKAEEQFIKARQLAQIYAPSEIYLQDMYIAVIKCYRGEIKDARILIRSSVDNVDNVDKNNAYAFASEIYLKSGILDSAYLFAHKLINNKSYDKDSATRLHYLQN
jgi:tetratricopeptide (TPR) repeat protein